MRRMLGLLSLCLAFSASQALAQEIRFVAGDIPPYAFQKDGQADGAAVKILQALLKGEGKTAPITFLPWSRAQQDAQQTDAIGIIPLSRTTEREPLYKWVGPLVPDRQVLVTKKGGKPAPKSVAEAKDWIVGVLRGSPGELMLKDAGFTRLDSVTDEATSARKLDAGHIDAWLVAELVAPFQYRLLNLDPSTLENSVDVRPNVIWLGLSKAVPDETVAKLQKDLDAMRSTGEVDAIIAPFK